MAIVWTCGSLASGPLKPGLNRQTHTWPVKILGPVAAGLLLFGLFVLVDLVALHIPYVSEVLHQVLTKTDRGPALPIVGTAVISAVGEEVFFRGALYTAIAGRHPVGWTTLAYGLVTIATGNLALVAAALGLGIVTGVQRRSTGGWWLLSSPIPSVTILALPR